MLNLEPWEFIALVLLQVGAFSVLKELVIVLPDCLADHIGSLTPGIEKALCVGFFPVLSFQVFEFHYFPCLPRSMIYLFMHLPLSIGQIFYLKFKD